MSKDTTTNYGSIEEGDKSFDTTQMQYCTCRVPLAFFVCWFLVDCQIRHEPKLIWCKPLHVCAHCTLLPAQLRCLLFHRLVHKCIPHPRALFDACCSQLSTNTVGEGKPLSKEEKIRKLIRVGVPLFLSALIVIAAFLFLFKDFTHLYPGRGGHGPTTVAAAEDDSAKSTATTVTHSTSNSRTPTSVIDSKCTAHDACSGLIGNCCPTNGTFVIVCCLGN